MTWRSSRLIEEGSGEPKPAGSEGCQDLEGSIPGIVSAIILGIMDAAAEGVKAKIQGGTNASLQ